MKKFITAALALTLTTMIISCGEIPRDRIYMTCGENSVLVLVYREKIVATIANETIKMRITESANGQKYKGMFDDSVIIIWNRADDWTMITTDDYGDTIITECY